MRRDRWMQALARATGLALLPAAAVGAARQEPDVLPPAIPNVVEEAWRAALPCVVKLYGGAIGSAHGYGTGVIVSPAGQIVTIDSVMLDARNLRAVLHDGRTFHAEVVRRDADRELALLRIESHGLPFLEAASSATLQMADGVIAAGNCFKVAEGEEPVTVMYGVLAARTVLDLRRRAQPLAYGGEVLVLDAVTSNPGMAGGPVLDLAGRWVGIVAGIAEAESTGTRLNYALPIEEVRAFLGRGGTSEDDASRVAFDTSPAGSAPGVDRGTTDAAGPRAAAGPGGGRPDAGLRLFRLGYRDVAAFVDRVAPGSPAHRAGIRADDLIIALDGKRVSTISDYERIAAAWRHGQTVRLTLKRGDEVLTVELTLEPAR
jgi:serine protease Do